MPFLIPSALFSCCHTAAVWQQKWWPLWLQPLLFPTTAQLPADPQGPVSPDKAATTTMGFGLLSCGRLLDDGRQCCTVHAMGAARSLAWAQSACLVGLLGDSHAVFLPAPLASHLNYCVESC